MCGALLEVFDDDETRPAWGRILSAPGVYTETEVTRVQALGLVSTHEIVGSQIPALIYAIDIRTRLATPAHPYHCTGKIG